MTQWLSANVYLLQVVCTANFAAHVCALHSLELLPRLFRCVCSRSSPSSCSSLRCVLFHQKKVPSKHHCSNTPVRTNSINWRSADRACQSDLRADRISAIRVERMPTHCRQLSVNTTASVRNPKIIIRRMMKCGD